MSTGSYTRDWDKSLKEDHSKFKTQPSYPRDVMDDVAQRLSTFFYGFLLGETTKGIKYLELCVQSTHPSSVADAILLYGLDVGTQCEAHLLHEGGSAIQLSKQGKINPDALEDLSTAAKAVIVNLLYPVGSIYTSIVATNPGTLFGVGTWEAFGAGKVLVGLNAADEDFDTVEETGGEKTHTLTTDEMPAHTHPGILLAGTSAMVWQKDIAYNYAQSTNTGSTGGDEAHNNLQPYIVVYMWKRTA